jgi:hypothetical protein
MSSKRIVQGDEGYTDIHADWVTNNRPSQFDRQGSWGWAAYRVLDRSAANPDFYQYASTNPTVTDDMGNVTNKGILDAGTKNFGFYEKVRINRHGIPTFQMVDPPNEL